MYALTLLSLFINLIRFAHGISRITPFRRVATHPNEKSYEFESYQLHMRSLDKYTQLRLTVAEMISKLIPEANRLETRQRPSQLRSIIISQ
jgi:hypothetical protein